VGDAQIAERNEGLIDDLRAVIADAPRAALLCKAFVDAVLGGVASDDPDLVDLAIPFYATLKFDPRLQSLRRAIREVEDMDDETAEVPAQHSAKAL
jgi:hypothetical protein